MNILISPYSRILRNGKQNPKNYPYWKEVIQEIGEKHHIIQIGISGEVLLVKDFRVGLPFEEIRKLVTECDLWMSVDNFLPHLAHHLKKTGIVVWSVSDPDIFGYPENFNIFKDRKYFRANQFDTWEACPYSMDAFPSVEQVLRVIRMKAQL